MRVIIIEDNTLKHLAQCVRHSEISVNMSFYVIDVKKSGQGKKKVNR